MKRRLREEVSEVILRAFRQPFAVQGTDIIVTMSIGIAAMLPHQGADEVMRNADLALYRAKGEGKACAASFEPEMHVAALQASGARDGASACNKSRAGSGRDRRCTISLSRAFRREGCSASRRWCRWQHPERGLLEPLDFISLAEETGLIVPLGRSGSSGRVHADAGVAAPVRSAGSRYRDGRSWSE